MIKVLFLSSDSAKVAKYVNELDKGYAVRADVAGNAGEFGRFVAQGGYDLCVVEYSGRYDQNLNDFVNDLLHKLPSSPRQVPLILLVQEVSREITAELMLRGVADCVAIDSLGHLPVAARRALNEKALRDERDRVERELRRTEAHYRALAGNLNYGICRCSPEGNFVDVNQALVAMLGYSSKDELLAADLTAIAGDSSRRAQLLKNLAARDAGEPAEEEWVRKGGVILKVRVSAREVHGELGQLEGYEVIAEDVTKQRELEERLRRQAASDPLTGLSNYRHLIDALDMELKRSNRTKREFSLLMFDMDGLKQINDHHGHLVGSQALCRVADALTISCRDIDTAARYGGDEFALLLPETDALAAHAAARRICANIAEDGNGPPLSVSVGVSVYPEDGETVDSILNAADAAMYKMKRQRCAEPGN
ncbi:MAG: hypothetical protein NVS9B4_16240 [Candidatus Acidiferrum sp.]